MSIKSHYSCWLNPWHQFVFATYVQCLKLASWVWPKTGHLYRAMPTNDSQVDTHTHTLGNPMIYGGHSELVFIGFTSQLINHEPAMDPIKYLFLLFKYMFKSQFSNIGRPGAPPFTINHQKSPDSSHCFGQRPRQSSLRPSAIATSRRSSSR